MSSWQNELLNCIGTYRICQKKQFSSPNLKARMTSFEERVYKITKESRRRRPNDCYNNSFADNIVFTSHICQHRQALLQDWEGNLHLLINFQKFKWYVIFYIIRYIIDVLYILYIFVYFFDISLIITYLGNYLCEGMHDSFSDIFKIKCNVLF